MVPALRKKRFHGCYEGWIGGDRVLSEKMKKVKNTKPNSFPSLADWYIRTTQHTAERERYEKINIYIKKNNSTSLERERERVLARPFRVGGSISTRAFRAWQSRVTRGFEDSNHTIYCPWDYWEIGVRGTRRSSCVKLPFLCVSSEIFSFAFMKLKHLIGIAICSAHIHSWSFSLKFCSVFFHVNSINIQGGNSLL